MTYRTIFFMALLCLGSILVNAAPILQFRVDVQRAQLSGDKISDYLISDFGYGLSADLGYAFDMYKKKNIQSILNDSEKLVGSDIMIDHTIWRVFFHIKTHSTQKITEDTLFLYSGKKNSVNRVLIQSLVIKGDSMELSDYVLDVSKLDFNTIASSDKLSFSTNWLELLETSNNIMKSNKPRKAKNIHAMSNFQAYIQPLLTVRIGSKNTFKGVPVFGGEDEEMEILNIRHPFIGTIEAGLKLGRSNTDFGVFAGLSQLYYEVTDEYARFLKDTTTSGKNINLIWGLIFRSRIHPNSIGGFKLSFDNGSIQVLDTSKLDWKVSTARLGFFYQYTF